MSRMVPAHRMCQVCFERLAVGPRRGAPSRYPFGELEIDEEREIDMPRANVAPAAAQYGKRHNRRFRVFAIRGKPDRCLLLRIA